MAIFRFIAFLLLVGLVAVVGINVYNAGVSAGIAADVGNAIASGAPIPAGYNYGPYVGQGWGHGFGFGEFLLGIFLLFLFFGLLRAVVGAGRWDGHHGGDRQSRWSSRHDYLDSWHRERHGETPPTPTPDKA